MSNRALREIKKYLNDMSVFPKFNLGSLLVLILCFFLIVISTFTQIKISMFGHSFVYIPQIPIILFIGALLGPVLARIPVFLYIAMGLLGVPIFASGGGFGYYMQFGFGYILGYFLAVQSVGNIIANSQNWKSYLKASISGAFIIHILGLIYLSTLVLLQKHSTQVIFAWGMELTFKKILIDIIVGFIFIYIARLFRKYLWIAMD